MKFILLLTTILCVIDNSTSINITCNSNKYDFQYSPVICCNISSDFVITSEYEEIFIQNNKSDFKGFLADQKSIAYLPNGIEKCCDKIEVLMIRNSGLKEITQKNIRNFYDMAVLDLSFNEIRILEADLFERNSNIKNIYLNGNKIAALASTVFDKLKKIKNLSGYLYMDGNECKANKEPITNIQQYKDELKETDCFKYEKLVMIRKSVKTEKIKADIKCLFGSDSNQKIMLDLNDRMNNFEDEVAKLLSTAQITNNTSALFDELVSKTYEKLVPIIQQKVHSMNVSVYEKMVSNIANLNNSLNEFKKATKIVDEITKNVEDIKKHSNNTLKEMKTLQENQNQASQQINETKQNLFRIGETVKILHENITSLTTKINEGTHNSNKINLEIVCYINTVLLIIIITVLIFLIFRNQHNSKINSKSSNMKSNQLNPQESIITSTINAPEDDYSSVAPRNRNYDPYIENQIYDSVPNTEIQNDANQLSVLNLNDESKYECCGLNNDIYGTACDEDLYSEVISPKTAQSKKNMDDDDDIYAVVYKPQID